MTVRRNSVFYRSTNGVARLRAADGTMVWRTPRATVLRRMSFSSPTVVSADAALLVSDALPAEKPVAEEKVKWGRPWLERAWLQPPAQHTFCAYPVEDGKELRRAASRGGYNSPIDLLVIGDEVWVGSDFQCYDLKTGEEGRKIAGRGPNEQVPTHSNPYDRCDSSRSWASNRHVQACPDRRLCLETHGPRESPPPLLACCVSRGRVARSSREHRP